MNLLLSASKLVLVNLVVYLWSVLIVDLFQTACVGKLEEVRLQIFLGATLQYELHRLVVWHVLHAAAHGQVVLCRICGNDGLCGHLEFILEVEDAVLLQVVFIKETSEFGSTETYWDRPGEPRMVSFLLRAINRNRISIKVEAPNLLK